jgi:uncharacterized lipoprotein
MKNVLVSLCVAALLAGCALDPIPEGAVKEDKEYSTGSNLPKRDRAPVTTMSKEQVEQLQRGTGQSMKGGGGP